MNEWNVHWDRYLSEYFRHCLSVLFYQFLIIPLSPTVVILQMTMTFYIHPLPLPLPLLGDSRYWANGFTITLRQTTLDRTPVDERSPRCRDIYWTTHNTYKRQTSMPPPRDCNPHTHDLDRASTGIGAIKLYTYIDIPNDRALQNFAHLCISFSGCWMLV
jgi:hypothetical protein